MITENNYIAAIENKAKRDALHCKLGEDGSIQQYEQVLKGWWCKFYKRPMKDPILESYSLYDLLFEFYLHTNDDNESVANDAIDEHKEEVEDLFKDFEEPSKAPFGPSSQEQTDDDFLKEAFKEDGWSMNEEDFKGED